MREQEEYPTPNKEYPIKNVKSLLDIFVLQA
jgi:hypothetical protein